MTIQSCASSLATSMEGVVTESGICVSQWWFFKEGLPPPTFHDLAAQLGTLQPNIAPDEPLSLPAPTSQHIVVQLLGHYMKTMDHHANMPVASTADESSNSGSSDDLPMHNVAHVPDFPKQSLCSGHMRGEPGGEMCNVAFSACLPGGIELSQMPGPHSVREAMAASDAAGWVDVMDCEMDNLHTHNVYELVPHTSGMRAIRLSWVLHRKFKNSAFDKHKVRLVARGNHQRPGIDYGESFTPVMCLESLRTLPALAASNNLNIIQVDITLAYLHGTLRKSCMLSNLTVMLHQGKRLGCGVSRKACMD